MLALIHGLEADARQITIDGVDIASVRLEQFRLVPQDPTLFNGSLRDKVVVLDAGHVVEQGSVRELLARPGDDAFFRRLCEQSGDIEGIERAANTIR
jgi:ABC-type multidrug transport system fused ATPase/permease subunit